MFSRPSDRPALRPWLRSLAAYVGAVAVVLAAASVAGHLLAGTSYAGVTDDALVGAAVEAYRPYLRTVVVAIAALVAALALALGLATSGLLWLRRDPEAPLGALRTFPLALLSSSLFVAFEAWGHPGLFLATLSALPHAAIALRAAHALFPLLLAASALGWARLLFSRTRPAALLLGSSGAVVAVAVLVARHPPVDAHPTAAASASASAEPVPPPPAGRFPNVLLLAVDSLRPDRIDAAHTPHLAALLAESVYFPSTFVTLPRTAPSWAAMLTSLPPLENGIETMFPSRARSDLSKLAMPAHLASLGFATSVSSEYAGEAFARIDFGFEQARVPEVELKEIVAGALLGRHAPALAAAGALYTAGPFGRALLPPRVRALLRGFETFSTPDVLAGDLDQAVAASAGRPFFVTLFFSQPHFPYTSSGPYWSGAGVEGADPALRFGKDPTRGEVRTAEDRAQIDALYRAALAETDAAIGEVLDGLRARGVLDDTIVVLTADHGEALYECEACVGHGDNLRGTMALRVPLAFRLPPGRFPAAKPGVRSSNASQLDLYPTLLSLLDVPRPPIQKGLPLLAHDGAPLELPQDRVFFAETGEWLWPTPAVPEDRLAYPPITEVATLDGDRIVVDEKWMPVVRAAKQRAAIRPPYELVYVPGRRAVSRHLYDLERDPLGEHDVAAEHPDVAAELARALDRSVLRHASMLSVAGYYLTRPPSPHEEYY